MKRSVVAALLASMFAAASFAKDPPEAPLDKLPAFQEIKQNGFIWEPGKAGSSEIERDGREVRALRTPGAQVAIAASSICCEIDIVVEFQNLDSAARPKVLASNFSLFWYDKKTDRWEQVPNVPYSKSRGRPQNEEFGTPAAVPFVPTRGRILFENKKSREPLALLLTIGSRRFLFPLAIDRTEAIFSQLDVPLSMNTHATNNPLLKVEELRWTRGSRSASIGVAATIRNGSGQALRSATLEFSFFDAQENQVGSRSVPIQNLEPGGTWKSLVTGPQGAATAKLVRITERQ